MRRQVFATVPGAKVSSYRVRSNYDPIVNVRHSFCVLLLSGLIILPSLSIRFCKLRLHTSIESRRFYLRVNLLFHRFVLGRVSAEEDVINR